MVIVRCERIFVVYDELWEERVPVTRCDDNIIKVFIASNLEWLILHQHNQVRSSSGKEVTCTQEPYCILYSGDLNQTVVAAGTVFRAVLVWNVATGDIVHKLVGHTGVIFDTRLIGCAVVSVSDDRSVRFWPDALEGNSKEAIVMFGHTARIWKVYGLNSDRVVTASEDATLRVWDTKTGK